MSHIILFVAVVLFGGATSKDTPNVTGGCKSGFKRPGCGNCYLYCTARDKWSAARAYCLGLGTRLLEIETSKEQSLMVSVLKKNLSDSVWTGGNDIVSEGVWRWGNTPIGPYTAWYGDNPSSNDGNEDCLELRKDANFGWNDIDCKVKNYFVCEHEYFNMPWDV